MVYFIRRYIALGGTSSTTGFLTLIVTVPIRLPEGESNERITLFLPSEIISKRDKVAGYPGGSKGSGGLVAKSPDYQSYQISYAKIPQEASLLRLLLELSVDLHWGGLKE